MRSDLQNKRACTGYRLQRSTRCSRLIALFAFIVVGTFAGHEVAQAKDAGKLHSLKVAYTVTTPNFSELGLFYARDHGLFKKHGLDVSIQMLNGDTLGLQSLVSGNSDISWFSNQLLYQSLLSGAAIKGFLEASQVQDYELLSKSDIKTVKDMEGRVLATSGPGGIAQVIPFALFKEKGLDTSKVRTVNVGGTSSRLKALAGGVVDAAMGHVVDAIRFMAKVPPDKFHVLANLGKDLPHFQFALFVAKKETFDTRMKDLTAFSEAVMEGSRIVANNEAAAIAEFRRYSKDLSDQQLHQVYVGMREINMFAVDGGLKKAYFDYTVKTLRDANILKKDVSYAQAFDLRPRNAALKAIGEASASK
jgi:NitT/TauT family transport system substrate-binding protein